MKQHLTVKSHGSLYLLRQIQLGELFLEYYSDVPIPGVITNGTQPLQIDVKMSIIELPIVIPITMRQVKPIFHCDAKPFGLGTFVLGSANSSRHPTQNPNVSQWNIGCIGYQMPISCFGHVHFMFFVLISFAFEAQRKPSFQWNMGLKHIGDGKKDLPTGIFSLHLLDRK